MSIKSNSKIYNSSRNVAFGFILKMYQLLMPFIIRTVIIYVLGLEYAGLNSLFKSILQVLNIAELGIGTIMVYYMYKPIAENDAYKICALMRLYKIYYRVIGMIILVVGLTLSPFLPYLIKDEIPSDVNLYILYYMNLATTVFSYWLFAYKNSLFQAHQRNDIASKVTIITDTIKYGLQISLLFIFKNYYYYVIVVLIIQVLNNIVIAAMADRIFPQYKAQGTIPKEERSKINSSIKDIFYGKIGQVVTLSVDSIVISAFLGIIPLAKYQNYFFIINALISFFTIFYQSLRASIGTNIIVKKMDDNYADYKFITFLIMAVLSFSSACLLNMFQPFIELWVGKKNLLDEQCVILLIIYFVVYELTILIGCYKDISGKWHADRFRPLITAVVNLIINIILVQCIGLYGILLSTITSYVFINIPWLYNRVFKDVFSEEYKKGYAKYLFVKLYELIVITIATYLICKLFVIKILFLKLVVNLIICTFVSMVLIYLFNKKDDSWIRAKKIIIKFIAKVKKHDR